MSHDHKTGNSEEGFAKAAEKAVVKYERWCKDNHKDPEPEVEVELRVKIRPDSSLSEYIAVLRTND